MCPCNVFPSNSISRKVKPTQTGTFGSCQLCKPSSVQSPSTAASLLSNLSLQWAGKELLPFSKAILVEEIALQEFGAGWSLVWVNLQTLLSNQRQQEEKNTPGIKQRLWHVWGKDPCSDPFGPVGLDWSPGILEASPLCQPKQLLAAWGAERRALQQPCAQLPEVKDGETEKHSQETPS